MRTLSSDPLTMHYHDTYWYAQVVFRTLADKKLNFCRTQEEFFGDQMYPRLISAFPKWTLLHDYILFMIEQVEFEKISTEGNSDILRRKNDVFAKVVSATRIEFQLREHGIAHKTFIAWAEENRIQLLDAESQEFADYYEYLGHFYVGGDEKRIVQGPRATAHPGYASR